MQFTGVNNQYRFIIIYLAIKLEWIGDRAIQNCFAKIVKFILSAGENYVTNYVSE